MCGPMKETLTKEEKRILIAESCGWRDILKSAAQHQHPMAKKGDGDWVILPDYFTDLNDCHEMEKAIPRNLHGKYAHKLCLRIGDELLHEYEGDFNLLSATASQRAETFGLTMGLWT